MIDKNLYVQRIATASQVELLCINYELAIEYIEDARVNGNSNSIVEARRCVNLLMKSLDMKYALSQTLYSLYLYVDRRLVQALFSRSDKTGVLDECSVILSRLMVSFKSLQNDNGSEAVMENTQHIYAGLTYSSNSLDEYIPGDNKRGYKA